MRYEVLQRELTFSYRIANLRVFTRFVFLFKGWHPKPPLRKGEEEAEEGKGVEMGGSILGTAQDGI